jgi:predicted nucleic acid-binding Zn finger protein
MSIRQQKGLQIAQRANIIQQGRLYIVPSQSGRGKYKVDAEKKRCTCPDYDFRREPCKHLYAVECVIEKTKTTTTQTDAEGNKTTTTTETVKVTRKTYPQVWPPTTPRRLKRSAFFFTSCTNSVRAWASPRSSTVGPVSRLRI